jgi:hypothetical protein
MDLLAGLGSAIQLLLAVGIILVYINFFLDKDDTNE